MKNILVKVILILLMIVFVFVYYDRNNEHFISDYEDLYEIALSYIKEEEIQIDNKDKDQFGYHAFYNYDKLGITEDNDYQYVYMWILSDNYYYSDEPILSSGYSVFYKFTFKDNKIIKFEIPKDGSYYKKSIKRMCNNTIIYNKVINYTSNMSNDEQITNYYNNLKESMKIKQSDIVDKNGLLFTISWKNADWVTVSLSVYDNKTYKLFTNY